MLIEGVRDELLLASRHGECGPGHEPQQQALAAAMRAITLDRLLERALRSELHGTAVTASRMHRSSC